MKEKLHYFLILTVFIGLISCSTTTTPIEKKTNEIPSWYLNIKETPGIIVGYGEGESLKIATVKAQNDLAAQIEVHVKSEFLLEEKGNENNSTLFLEQSLSSIVDVVLQGAVRLEEEFLNDSYYTAWSYDNRPMRSRALDAAVHAGPPSDKDTLKSHLPFTRYLENNRAAVAYQLDYRQGNWYLLIGKESIPVSRSELAENFFPLLNVVSLSLKQGLKYGLTVPGLDPYELVSGQLFSIVYEPEEGPGYLNLFYIDNKGVTLNLIENSKVSGESIEYPDLSQYDGLIAEKDFDIDQSTDMILAVKSPEPLDFASFTRKVSSNTTDGDEDGMHSYGLLLEQLDAAHCSSMVLRIIE
jgi:LPP20 lipoprotein